MKNWEEKDWKWCNIEAEKTTKILQLKYGKLEIPYYSVNFEKKNIGISVSLSFLSEYRKGRTIPKSRCNVRR